MQLSPRSLLRRWRTHRARRKFNSIPLGPEDLCIDCGANVGEITAQLSASGARVVAFEPNPEAFTLLRNRFAQSGNVACHQAAVGVSAGRTRLYLHKQSKVDPVAFSTGSSVLQDKPNVDASTWVEVEVVDLSAYILGLQREIAILKIDIEGAEYEVLQALIASGAIRRTRHVFVETHAHRMVNLRQAHADLQAALRKHGIENCSLDWD